MDSLCCVVLCCVVLCCVPLCPLLAPFRYLLELKKEHRAEFLRKVTGMAERIGFKVHRECAYNHTNCSYVCVYIATYSSCVFTGVSVCGVSV